MPQILAGYYYMSYPIVDKMAVNAPWIILWLLFHTKLLPLEQTLGVPTNLAEIIPFVPARDNACEGKK